jgi:hypothetical protein
MASRIDRNSNTDIGDLHLPEPAPEGVGKRAGLESRTGRAGGHDGVEHGGPTVRDFFAAATRQYTLARGGDATVSSTEFQAQVLYDSANRLPTELRDKLAFLARRPDELKTLTDLKNLAERLGFGGVLERALDKALGPSINDAVALFRKLGRDDASFAEVKDIFSRLADSKDLRGALGSADDLVKTFKKFSALAHAGGDKDLGDRFVELVKGTSQFKELAERYQAAKNFSPTKFAKELAQDVSDLRTFEDLKRLADKHGLGSVFEKALGANEDVRRLRDLATNLPEAKQKAEAFAKQLESLAKNKTPAELAKAFKDIPGGLDTLSKAANALGQGQLAGKLEQARNVAKQVDKHLDAVKGMSPKQAQDYLLKKVKEEAPGKVRDLIAEQLPGNKHYEGNFEVHGAAYSKTHSIGSKDGPFYAEHRLELLSAKASGSGSIDADLKSGKLKAQGQIEARVSLVHAEAEAQFRYGVVEGRGSATAQVGAKAQAQGSLDVDLKNRKVVAEGRASAIVGASATAEGEISAGGVGAKGRAGVRAGAGVEVGGKFGYDNGKVTVGFNIAAALGIGFDLGFEISLDFNKISDTIKQYVPGAKEVFEVASKVGGAVKDGVKAVGDAVASVGKSVKKVFSGW